MTVFVRKIVVSCLQVWDMEYAWYFMWIGNCDPSLVWILLHEPISLACKVDAISSYTILHRYEQSFERCCTPSGQNARNIGRLKAALLLILTEILDHKNRDLVIRLLWRQNQSFSFQWHLFLSVKNCIHQVCLIASQGGVILRSLSVVFLFLFLLFK